MAPETNKKYRKTKTWCRLLKQLHKLVSLKPSPLPWGYQDGQKFELNVVSVGHNEEVIAVGVIGCVSCNRNPHVTATWASKGMEDAGAFVWKVNWNQQVLGQLFGKLCWGIIHSMCIVNTFVLLFSGAMLVSGRVYVPASYNRCRDFVLQSFR